MAQESEFCTASEAGDILEVTADTIRRWTRSGKLAAVVLPSGRRRYRRSDIVAIRAAEPTVAAS